MRWSFLLPAALLAFGATLAQADEIPKRKPGLWELHWHSNGITPSEPAAALLPNSAKMCIDDTTDAKLVALYDACHVPVFFAPFSPQFTKELACEAADDELKLKLISRSEITFSGDTAYRIEVKTRLELPVRGSGEYGGGRDGKWLGACPRDMRPGDLIAGGQPKINVLEKLKKPHR